eukprot:5496070-Lingulodinium_polyedra.AAC.1
MRCGNAATWRATRNVQRVTRSAVSSSQRTMRSVRAANRQTGSGPQIVTFSHQRFSKESSINEDWFGWACS